MLKILNNVDFCRFKVSKCYNMATPQDLSVMWQQAL